PKFNRLTDPALGSTLHWSAQASIDRSVVSHSLGDRCIPLEDPQPICKTPVSLALGVIFSTILPSNPLPVTLSTSSS
ncbi:hypothetical protein, partial [Oculatella sp. LEGE 06141]|uniref:hypothetical protein n=1 Tax=Oculatella sp. LEGE 06141 TaxID=1828648 RepID=UPI001D14A2FB